MSPELRNRINSQAGYRSTTGNSTNDRTCRRRRTSGGGAAVRCAIVTEARLLPFIADQRDFRNVVEFGMANFSRALIILNLKLYTRKRDFHVYCSANSQFFLVEVLFLFPIKACTRELDRSVLSLIAQFCRRATHDELCRSLRIKAAHNAHVGLLEVHRCWQCRLPDHARKFPRELKN